jgi:hypothetical protein
MDEKIIHFFNYCYKFNEIAGKANLASKTDLLNQLKLIQEEVQEMQEAMDINDPVELLDGLVDTMVTCAGMMQKLESLGVDVSKAMTNTALNNLTKFTDNATVANESVVHYIKNNTLISAIWSDKYKCFVLKDADDKVRKPIDYEPNNLKDCVPEDLIEKGFQ